MWVKINVTNEQLKQIQDRFNAADSIPMVNETDPIHPNECSSFLVHTCLADNLKLFGKFEFTSDGHKHKLFINQGVKTIKNIQAPQSNEQIYTYFSTLVDTYDGKSESLFSEAIRKFLDSRSPSMTSPLYYKVKVGDFLPEVPGSEIVIGTPQQILGVYTYAPDMPEEVLEDLFSQKTDL